MTKINLGAFKVDAITQEEAITLIKNQLLKSSKEKKSFRRKLKKVLYEKKYKYT